MMIGIKSWQDFLVGVWSFFYWISGDFLIIFTIDFVAPWNILLIVCVPMVVQMFADIIIIIFIKTKVEDGEKVNPPET